MRRPAALIDLKNIPELAGVAREGDNLVIGAMTRHADVARSNVVQAAIPALASLAGVIGDPHVRNMGTIGGSLANNDPSADYPAAALALGATIVTNKRRIGAQDFFTGLFETALETGELITQVSFPIPQKAAYMKFPNPASRYALVGVFVAKTAGGVRVAVTGAGGNGVFRAEAFEAALNSEFLAGRARWRLRARQRTQLRPSRRRRLSRAPHRGYGETRRGGGRLRRAKKQPNCPVGPALTPPRPFLQGAAANSRRGVLSCRGKRRPFRPRSTKL